MPLTVGSRLGHPRDFVSMCWRQWKTERRLARRGIFIRTSDLNVIEASYSRMARDDFEGINARQNWVNWRIIPRAMSGLVPTRPLTIVDLGCGIGSSTSVLAFYSPQGSHILAYEISRPLARIIRKGSDFGSQDGVIVSRTKDRTLPLSSAGHVGRKIGRMARCERPAGQLRRGRSREAR